MLVTLPPPCHNPSHRHGHWKRILLCSQAFCGSPLPWEESPPSSTRSQGCCGLGFLTSSPSLLPFLPFLTYTSPATLSAAPRHAGFSPGSVLGLSSPLCFKHSAHTYLLPEPQAARGPPLQPPRGSGLPWSLHCHRDHFQLLSQLRGRPESVLPLSFPNSAQSLGGLGRAQ